MVLEELGDGDKFMAVLEWMIALGHRQSGVLEAGLVYVTYDPQEVRDLTFSASDTVQQLSVIQNCLRSSFRHSDLICRDGVNFWILAPFTQIDPVLDKVQRVIKTAPENGLSFAKNNFRVFMLKNYIGPGLSPSASPLAFLEALLEEETAKS